LHWFNQLGVAAMSKSFALMLGSLVSLGCASTTSTARDAGEEERGVELGAPLPVPPDYDARVTPTAQGFRVAVWRTLTCRIIRVARTQAVGVAVLQVAAAVFLRDDEFRLAKAASALERPHVGTDTSELESEEVDETLQFLPCFTKPAIGAKLIIHLEHGQIARTTDTQGSVLFVGDEGLPKQIFVYGRQARLRR
jgi:hypothetical protein